MILQAEIQRKSTLTSSVVRKSLLSSNIVRKSLLQAEIDMPEMVVDIPVLVPPTIIENSVPTKIKIPYDIALDEASIPAVGSYVLGSGRTVTLVEPLGLFVYLTVSSRYYWGDTETVAYTAPVSPNPMIKSTLGGEAASFTATAITNNVTIDSRAASLIAQMTAAGETPTTARQVAINTYIVNLKANSLFETQFDALVFSRGKGAASTKMNFIANIFNALGVNNPTNTEDVGYNSDGSTSYIDTQYTPSTAGGLMTVNDGCWGFKISGTILNGISGHGVLDGSNNAIQQINLTGGSASNRINNTVAAGAGVTQRVSGYYCLSRSSNTAFSQMVNSSITNVNINSGSLPTQPLNMLRRNISTPYYTATTEILECYWIGKSISQANFLLFQTLTDAFFAAY